jgi:hypothetical protein
MLPGGNAPWISRLPRILAWQAQLCLDNPLLPALVLFAIAGWIHMRATVWAALAAGVWIVHTLLSPHTETRLYLGSWVPVLAGAGYFLAQLRPTATAAILLGLLALSFPWARKLDYGMRPAAAFVMQERFQAVLVASEGTGEGPLIANIACRNPRPAPYLVRASKSLASQTWMGQDYRARFRDAAELATWLRASPIEAVVLDKAPGPKYDALRQTLTAPGEWHPAFLSRTAIVYARKNPPALTASFLNEIDTRLGR